MADNLHNTAESRYNSLSEHREHFLNRGRQCSELTIPTLIPEDSHAPSQDFYSPFQSVGSRGVNNLFAITDGNNEVKVKFVGVLPDLFAEGRGVIVRGQFKDNVFIASQVLAKHDEKYMPRELENTLNNNESN